MKALQERVVAWVRDDGQAEVRLTGKDSAHCSDSYLLTKARQEARKIGMSLKGGSLVITEWRE